MTHQRSTICDVSPTPSPKFRSQVPSIVVSVSGSGSGELKKFFYRIPGIGRISCHFLSIFIQKWLGIPYYSYPYSGYFLH